MTVSGLYSYFYPGSAADKIQYGIHVYMEYLEEGRDYKTTLCPVPISLYTDVHSELACARLVLGVPRARSYPKYLNYKYEGVTLVKENFMVGEQSQAVEWDRESLAACC